MKRLSSFAVKDFRAQLRQLVLTGVAIAVGVAFLVLSVGGSGALVQFYSQSATVEVGNADLQAVPDSGRGLPKEAAARAGEVASVAQVSERVLGAGKVVGSSGHRLLDDRAVVTSIAADAKLRWQRLDGGRWPQGPDEAVLDRGTAEHLGARPGDTVRLVKPDGKAAGVKLTGLLDTSSSTTLGSQAAIGVPYEAMKTYATGLTTTQLDMDIREGADASATAKAVKKALDGNASVVTHARAVDNAKQAGGTAYLIVLSAALSFVMIAMAVARMVVTNTFSVVLAQRARQLALLRCIGADRDQVRRIIRSQGLMLGVLASATGLAAGGGACVLGTWLLRTFADLGPVELSLLPHWTVFVLAGLFGALLTVWAVRKPAKAAAAVPPVAALAQSGSATLPEPGHKAVRQTFSVLLLIFGVYMLTVGLFHGDLALLNVTIGAICSFFAVLRFAPHLLPPLVGLLGFPARRWLGTTGKLATQQLRSNARRTSAAASAMLVGVTVAVSAVTAIGATGGSMESKMSSRVPAVFTLNASDNKVPAGAVESLRTQPELAVTPVRAAHLTVNGHKSLVIAADPAQFQEDAKGVPEARALKDGQALTDTARGSVTVAGTRLAAVSDHSSWLDTLLPGADMYVTEHTLDRLAPGATTVAAVCLDPADGSDHDTARTAIDRALSDYPHLRVSDAEAKLTSVRQLLDRMLLVITTLLGFSMAIAALGVAATLMLAVEERTREFGMLRAIGMAGRQLREMLTLESVLLALTGAVAGTVLGLVYGVLAVRSVLGGSPLTILASSDGTALTVLGILAATALTGIAASVLPARRVRRMAVVDALHTSG
ncbi:FtsX-like permease family protein [Streptomyces tubercidicus]|uniref:FtsX-like permease family protein n=1 Tax=Streptomyces tubercidicus TaxID=47759 RepID=UPI0036AFBB44